MKIIKTKELTSIHFDQINNLWNMEYPEKLNNRFSILLEGTKWFLHYIVINEDEGIIGWSVIFNKDDEIRFSILVHSNYQKKGLGGHIINELKNDHDEFYGWVIDHDNDKKTNGDFYRSPMGFYRKHQFEILNDRIETEIISAVKIRWKKSVD